MGNRKGELKNSCPKSGGGGGGGGGRLLEREVLLQKPTSKRGAY